MTTLVTKKQYSDVFNLMKTMTRGLLHTKLQELQETTETVFKANQDRSRLYNGVRKAMKIISKEDLQAKITILLAVADKTSNSAIKSCALKKVAKVCVEHDDFNEVRNISDDDKRDLAFFAIVKRMIKTDDLQKALEIIEEDDIIDSAMGESLCAEIVTKFIKIEAEEDEIALRAADKACSTEISAQLARFFAEREKKMDPAMEALGQIQDSELMEKTLLECTQYIASEEDLNSVINFINESEQGILLNRMEKLAGALIDHKKMDLAMKVVDSLAKGGEDEERVSKTLTNICQHFIANNHTANVVKIADTIIDLMESHKSKGKTLLLAIIKSLNDHHKPTIAMRVQRLLAKL